MQFLNVLYNNINIRIRTNKNGKSYDVRIGHVYVILDVDICFIYMRNISIMSDWWWIKHFIYWFAPIAVRSVL